MIPTMMNKIVAVTNPVAINDNTAWTTNEIDTLGWDYCSIYFMLGATDIAVAALKVQESDTTGASFADVTGLNFATSPATLPGATEDNGIWAFHIDLRGRKRFLDLVATGGDGAVGGFAAAWAVLSKGEEMPNTATKRGLTAELTLPA